MINQLKQVLPLLLPAEKIKQALKSPDIKAYLRDVIIDTLRYSLKQNKNLITILHNPNEFIMDFFGHLPLELRDEAIEHFGDDIIKFIDCEGCEQL